MTRLLLLLLFLTPAHADLPTNFWSQVIRDKAKFVTNPPPREPTSDERLFARAVELIDKCREVAQLTVDRAIEAQRQTVARQCLDVTDPVERPMELGGIE